MKQCDAKENENLGKRLSSTWMAAGTAFAPIFLSDQWRRSSDRLQLETIDIYLLHNPEYFLSDALKRSPRANLDDMRDAFYDRICRAFVQMEHFVEEGKIRYYGISANTFPSPKGDFEHVSLQRCYDAACDAARTVHGNQGENHFKIIQLPYNLFEHAALSEANNTINGQDMTVLAGSKGTWDWCIGESSAECCTRQSDGAPGTIPSQSRP